MALARNYPSILYRRNHCATIKIYAMGWPLLTVLPGLLLPTRSWVGQPRALVVARAKAPSDLELIRLINEGKARNLGDAVNVWQRQEAGQKPAVKVEAAAAAAAGKALAKQAGDAAGKAEKKAAAEDATASAERRLRSARPFPFMPGNSSLLAPAIADAKAAGVAASAVAAAEARLKEALESEAAVDKARAEAEQRAQNAAEAKAEEDKVRAAAQATADKVAAEAKAKAKAEAEAKAARDTEAADAKAAKEAAEKKATEEKAVAAAEREAAAKEATEKKQVAERAKAQKEAEAKKAKAARASEAEAEAEQKARAAEEAKKVEERAKAIESGVDDLVKIFSGLGKVWEEQRATASEAKVQRVAAAREKVEAARAERLAAEKVCAGPFELGRLSAARRPRASAARVPLPRSPAVLLLAPCELRADRPTRRLCSLLLTPCGSSHRGWVCRWRRRRARRLSSRRR